MKLKKIKEEPATRNVFEFKHKGKKLFYSYIWTSTESVGITDEIISDKNGNRIDDQMLLDKVICSLWPIKKTDDGLYSILI